MGWLSDAWDWLGGKKKKKKRVFTETDSERSPTDELLQVLIGNPGKVEPKIVFKRISNDKEFLGICCVWGYGPVASAANVKVYLDNLIWTSSKYKVKNESLVQVQTFIGLDNQTATTWQWFKTKFNYNGNTHGRGIVYSLIAITLDGEVFPSDPKIHGEITRKVPIVNDGSERLLIDLPDVDNPALVASWFLRDPVVGYGFPASVIGDSFLTIRNWINNNKVQQHTNSGPMVPRFSTNGVLEGKKEDIFQAILDSFYAKIVFVDGKFEINFKGYNTAPEMTLDESNTTRDRTTFEGIEKSKRFNRVIVTFTNPDKNHETDQAIYPELDDPLFDTWLAEDNGILQEEEVNLKLVNNYYEALEQAKVLARESREATTYKLKGRAVTGDLIPYDAVAVDEPRKGWAGELFYVNEIDVQSDESEEYELELKSFNPTIYDWLNKGEYIPDAVIDPVDLSVIGAPTNLVFDSNYQTLTWTAPAENVAAYEVAVYTGTDSNNELNYVKTVTCSAAIKRFKLEPGEYTFVVKAFGIFGQSRAEITATAGTAYAVINLAYDATKPQGTQGKITFSHAEPDLVGHFVVSIKDTGGNIIQTYQVQPRSAQDSIDFATRIKQFEAD